MAAISCCGIDSDHIPFPALRGIVRKITLVTWDQIPSPELGQEEIKLEIDLLCFMC
jgi:hypothetical protein